jgi:xylan 1,4-beta-xylosidase
MMKRTLDLAKEAGVELRGVLTWAFTFPGSPLFAGYRALATNGIHLPVLNAFKLLGKLRGDRLPLVSSGARPMSDILESSVRGEPDVDALAAIDGDRVRILVWHYHDDLIDAASASVTLDVSVPASFGADVALTHTRVDDTHGDAFTVWQSQGSPEAPSTSELAALQAGMEPVVLSRDGAMVEDGVVTVSFDLPRFGLTLLELEPLDASEPAAPPASGAGCSFSSARSPRAPLALWLALGVALYHCRRPARGARRASLEARPASMQQLVRDWRYPQ